MASSKRDLYEVLGISKSATKDEIKSAYRKLAKKYHPDVNHEPDAADKFKEVQEAYDILYDDNKRKAYDQFGFAAFEQGGSTGGAGNPFGGGFSSQGFGDIDLSDIFSSFFGGGARQRQTAQGPQKGDNSLTRIRISFMDAVNGTKVSIPVTYDEPCPHCHGTGAESPSDIETCPHCGGRGFITQPQRTIFGVMETQQTCPHCGGQGKVIRNKCRTCQGAGYTRVKKEITVNVPAGINSGQQIRVTGKGGRGYNGGPNGDLYVEVLVAPHEYFKRDGNDIHLEVPLSFVDCALGCSIDVPTVYGEVSVKIAEGTQPDQILKIKERGIKDLRTGKPGNQYLHIKVKTPVKLTKGQRELLEEFQKQTNKKESFFSRWKEGFNK
ncbi:MAG: molecular chaperone DnaJ [Erysipelotrichaceae bacterium]|jgi:molecular chaperone DnaJ|nr:molecular chaperone DnaJ [Erysipelotrichaceae bacterium]